MPRQPEFRLPNSIMVVQSPNFFERQPMVTTPRPTKVPPMPEPSAMIATLGGQPQVVTFALDALRAGVKRFARCTSCICRRRMSVYATHCSYWGASSPKIATRALPAAFAACPSSARGTTTARDSHRTRCRRGMADSPQPDCGLEGTGPSAAYLCCGRAAYGRAADHIRGDAAL